MQTTTTMNYWGVNAPSPSTLQLQTTIQSVLEPAIKSPEILRGYLGVLQAEGKIAGKARDAYDCLLARFFATRLKTLVDGEAEWAVVVSGGTVAVRYWGKQYDCPGGFSTWFPLSIWANQLVQLVDMSPAGFDQDKTLYPEHMLVLLHEAEEFERHILERTPWRASPSAVPMPPILTSAYFNNSPLKLVECKLMVEATPATLLAV